MLARDSQPPVAGLSQLLNALRPELLRFLTARLGDAVEAEDALQDLWVRVAATGPVANGRAYLYRCAQNLCLDRARARRRRAAREGEWRDAQQGPAEGIDPVDPRLNAEAALMAREEAAMLAAAIAALPTAAGRAFRLHKIDGMSHAQVAMALGISLSGVQKHMAVAMAHLRRALADRGADRGADREADWGADDRRRLTETGPKECHGSGAAGTT